ncbi:DUF2339 domain-containing protein [Hoyosella rhizosphaerae]|uniref:DUF2339 domain-containing protein n=1 Tax=Hoyosella rhizosphaerae TaxID=1755582 RepID=UPI001665CA02|nr:DUF2339 domain-containing protein [Hoyosella rhizosphaerae]MBN4927046.1 DUF2339 domain-containing protein [Hoyosella rhizosphaerae]
MYPPSDRELAARLAARLQELSTQVQYARTELDLLQRSIQANDAPAPVQPHQSPRVQQPVQPPPMQPPAGQPASVDDQPEAWFEREGVVGRILAVTGAAVTLVGVALLLILAIQAGMLGPLGRVVVGGLLSAALLGVAWKVASKPGGRVGAVALAATGLAGLCLDVIAATALYEFVPAIVGLAVGFAIAAIGLGLALRWESLTLAVFVLLGTAILAPIVTGGLSATLIAFLITLMAASYVVQHQRDWPLLHVVRVAPPTLAMTIAVAEPGRTIAESYIIVALLAFLFAVGVGTSLALMRSTAHAHRAAPTGVIIAVALPVLASTNALPDEMYVTVCLSFAVACVVAALLVRGVPAHARVALGGVGAALVLAAALVASSQSLRPAVILSLALVLVAAAAVSPDGSRVRGGILAISGVYTVVGTIILMDASPPSALLNPSRALTFASTPVVVAAAILLAVVVTIGVVIRSTNASSENVEIVRTVCGLVGLYAFSMGTVTAGILIAGESIGFLAGHTVTTVGWMITAIALLLEGVSGQRTPSIVVIGLVLAAAAVLKLLIFDLAALDGAYRVVAFLLVGLLLLFAGTKYAQYYSTHQQAKRQSDIR